MSGVRLKSLRPLSSLTVAQMINSVSHLTQKAWQQEQKMDCSAEWIFIWGNGISGLEAMPFGNLLPVAL